MEYLHWLPRGRVLDVAMGRGRNALFLASQGFEVVGVDQDPASVAFCREEARRRGLSLTLHECPLETFPLKPASFDVILCFFFLDRSLIPRLQEALRPVGMFLYETFLIDQHLRWGKPRHREYCFGHNELLEWFRGYRILFYQEGILQPEQALVRLVAQKRE